MEETDGVALPVSELSHRGVGGASRRVFCLGRRAASLREAEHQGALGEWIPGSAGRQFSIGTIQYNVFQRRYNFDGTNYRNNGNPFCHWRTVTSYLDFSKLEFHYVFATKDVDSMQTTSYGYGVLQLISRDGSLIPEDGYYIYANGHDAAVSHSHTLVPVVKVPDNRNDNATKLLTATFPGHADALE
jgi:hypothetical protein